MAVRGQGVSTNHEKLNVFFVKESQNRGKMRIHRTPTP